MPKTQTKKIASTLSSARTKLERDVVISLAKMLSKHGADMSELLVEHGLSLAHHNALRILRGAGCEGLPCGVVGERLINKEPDITRLFDRMEKLGLVLRSRDQTDRRIVMTRITEQGLEILAKLDAPLDELLHRQFGHIPTVQLEDLKTMVQKIRDGTS